MPMERPLSVQIVIFAMRRFYEAVMANWRPEFCCMAFGARFAVYRPAQRP